MKIGKKLFLIMMMLNLAGAVALAGTVLTLAYKQINTHITTEIDTLTSENALFIKAWFESHFEPTRLLAQVLERYEQIDPLERRALVNIMVKTEVEEHPEVIGASSVWEPNALDALDAQFIDTPGSDSNGRFVPYWS